MKNSKSHIGHRVWLKSKVSLAAMNWEAYSYESETTKGLFLAYGVVRFAWSDSFVIIHTLNRAGPQSQAWFKEKITKLRNGIKDFHDILGTSARKQEMVWLNPDCSGATGSYAYCHDTIGEDHLVYFEIASCLSKIRIYPSDFDGSIPKMKRTLMTLIKELDLLIKAFENIEDYVNSSGDAA